MDPPSPVALRRMRPSEAPEYRRLRLRALEQDPLAFGSTLLRERAFPDELWQERAREGAESPEHATWFAVRPDGVPVGMVTYRFDRGEGRIFGMWLEPAWRGHGVGRRLLDAILAWARTVHPDAIVRLDVNPRQEAAVHLYRSRGFEFTGASEPLGHTAGEAALSMALLPRPPSERQRAEEPP